MVNNNKKSSNLYAFIKVFILLVVASGISFYVLYKIKDHKKSCRANSEFIKSFQREHPNMSYDNVISDVNISCEVASERVDKDSKMFVKKNCLYC